jgi:hypothetical protein
MMETKRLLAALGLGLGLTLIAVLSLSSAPAAYAIQPEGKLVSEDSASTLRPSGPTVAPDLTNYQPTTWPVGEAGPYTAVQVTRTITLNPSKDSFLVEDSPNNNAGAHTHVSAGTNGQGSRRRAVFAFDIAGNIPAGSTIISATFNLDVVRVPSMGEPMNSSFELHRLTADWGEGGGTGNGGGPANNGEVTWNSPFHNSSPWSTPGGDFSLTVSASTPVTGIGSYTWGPTADMAADVQSWLDTANYGWLLLSDDEVTNRTARRFGSKEGGAGASLTVVYTAIVERVYLPLVIKNYP